MIINSYTQKVYITLKILLIVLYVISLLKVWKNTPKYLKYVDLVFNLLIGILLIIIYNPFSHTKITSFHKKIAFSAGIAILINSAIIQYLKNKVENKIIKKNFIHTYNFLTSPEP